MAAETIAIGYSVCRFLDAHFVSPLGFLGLRMNANSPEDVHKICAWTRSHTLQRAQLEFGHLWQIVRGSDTFIEVLGS